MDHFTFSIWVPQHTTSLQVAHRKCPGDFCYIHQQNQAGVAQKSEVMSIKTTYQLAKPYKTLTHLGKTSNSMFRCLAWDLREDLEKFQNSFKFNSSKFQTFEWNLQIIASSEGEFYCFTAFEFICSTFFFVGSVRLWAYKLKPVMQPGADDHRCWLLVLVPAPFLFQLYALYPLNFHTGSSRSTNRTSWGCTREYWVGRVRRCHSPVRWTKRNTKKTGFGISNRGKKNAETIV